MKNLLRNCDETMLEKGSVPGEPGRERSSNCIKMFKIFLVGNFLILLCLLAYALFSLYQLTSAMRSTGEPYAPDVLSSAERLGNDSAVTSDFREWRRSIQRELEQNNGSSSSSSNRTSASNNLSVLLDTIASIMKNFGNGTSTPAKNEIVVGNLTDFEMRLLQEYAKMTKHGQETRTRFARTVRASGDESACNLSFALDSKNERYRVVILTKSNLSGGTAGAIKPAKIGEGQINISNTVNTFSNNKKQKDVRQCSFNIIYEPRKN